MNLSLEKYVLNLFAEKHFLTTKELSKAIAEHFPSWTRSTIITKIHQLKNQNLIFQPERGIYTTENTQNFIPTIDKSLKSTFNRVKKEFPYAEICAWDTKWLNEFMLHQLVKHYQVIEVEKDATESVFNSIAEKHKNAFLNPDREIYERYIANLDEAIIIKSFVSESPLETVQQIQVPSLEKLLVDMLADKEVFAAQQNEIEFIYRSVLSKYSLNLKKMKRYSKRRGKGLEVEKLINKILAKQA